MDLTVQKADSEEGKNMKKRRRDMQTRDRQSTRETYVLFIVPPKKTEGVCEGLRPTSSLATRSRRNAAGGSLKPLRSFLFTQPPSFSWHTKEGERGEERER